MEAGYHFLGVWLPGAEAQDEEWAMESRLQGADRQRKDYGGGEDPAHLAGEGGEVGEEGVLEKVDKSAQQGGVLDEIQIGSGHKPKPFDDSTPVCLAWTAGNFTPILD